MQNPPSALYLHIGHNKTGSSFLQSSLALSGSALAAQGVHYPLPDHIAKLARNGAMTSGNLQSKPGAFAALINQPRPAGHNRVLASGEGLFFYLSTDGAVFLDEIRATCPDVPLHVLLYIRNPVDHAVSVYHQRVKRGGFTGTLADSLKTYDMPKKVRRVLTRLREAGAQVTVLNYSNHRDTLRATMETWLGLPNETLAMPPVQQVNRSLTLAELELQRAFNRHLGEAARRYVSTPLCNSLPQTRSDTPPLSTDDLRAFLRRMRQVTKDPVFQTLIPAAEQYRIGTVARHQPRFLTPDPDAVFSFTPEQIEVLAQAICAALPQEKPNKTP